MKEPAKRFRPVTIHIRRLTQKEARKHVGADFRRKYPTLAKRPFLEVQAIRGKKSFLTIIREQLLMETLAKLFSVPLSDAAVLANYRAIPSGRR